MGELPEADAADAVVPNVTTRTTADPAPIVGANLELRLPHGFLNKRLLCQIFLRQADRIELPKRSTRRECGRPGARTIAAQLTRPYQQSTSARSHEPSAGTPPREGRRPRPNRRRARLPRGHSLMLDVNREASLDGLLNHFLLDVLRRFLIMRKLRRVGPAPMSQRPQLNGVG